MSDFISNHPDGKSDLYRPAPQASSNPSSPLGGDTPPENTAHQASIFSDYSDNPASSPVGQTPPPPPPFQASSGYPPAYNQSAQSAYSYAIYGTEQEPTDQRKNNFNTAAMVLGIVTWGGLLLCCGCFSLPTAILSIIFGVMGRSQGKFDGKGLAGFILGVSFLAFLFLAIAFLFSQGMFMSFDTGLDEDFLWITSYFKP
ncbi:MAG: DUF4190 domain-containing protein [Ruminococcaceae bacterium]|nr:DUF4190 domain-containing protein [Oscillospiraceae bacterium]